MATLSRLCGSGVLMASLLVSGSVWAGDKSNPAVTVDTFEAVDGQVYAAISIRPDVSRSATARDLVVLVDTSASQSGEHRTASLALARALMGELKAGDRASLAALDVKAQFMTGLVPAGSAEMQQGFQKLDQRAPLGTSNLWAGLSAAVDALPASSGRTRAIVYIGDGANTAGVFGADKLAELTARLREQRIAVYSAAVGSEINGGLLDRLAAETGGYSIDGRGELSAERLAAKLSGALGSAVIYPERVVVGDGSLPLLPSPAPPLRSDQSTLFLTRGTIGQSLKVSLEGSSDGAEVKREWSVRPATATPDHAYLADLWALWQNEKAVPAAGDARETLALAEADHGQMVTSMVLLGELAINRGMLDEASKFLNEAIKRDPSNLEAKVLLKSLDSKRRELAMAQDPAAVPPAAPQDDPVQPPAVPQPLTPESRAQIETAQELEKAAIEQLRALTNAELAEARRLMPREPQRAIDLLKGYTMLRIDSASDVPVSVRENLRRQVEASLRMAAREKERVDLERAASQQAAAQAAEMRRMQNLLTQQQQRQSQLMDQFWALMQERSYREALMVGRRSRELNHGEPLPELLVFKAETSANLSDLRELVEVRKHRFLLAMLQVDKSHVPFPDEPPIEYPDATWWEEMSKRRQKWARVDLTVPSKAEEKINEKLKDPVTLEFVETPLGGVIDFLRDYTDVNIVLDRVTLEEAGITTDTPVTIHVEQVALKSALKLLFESIGRVTYLIQDDVLKITSTDFAENDLVHKVYPVGDLVIPVGAGGGGMGGMMGGMGGGGMGGMGGGGMGGMGGGGMGGMGGGGMGGGFGFRNMPNNGGGGGAGAGAGAAGGGAQGDLSDELIELIQEVIAPETWDVRGGQGFIHYWQPNPALIIRQTSQVHGKIGDSLGQLRGGSEPKSSR